MADVKLHPSWLEPLRKEFDDPYMQALRQFLVAEKQAGKRIFPKSNNWFRALDLTGIKSISLNADASKGKAWLEVLNEDGYRLRGFAKDDAGHWHKMVQSGPAILEDDVEVQANSCVDRATVGETHIARGVKIDNMVQVGHGCEVGEDTLLCAQAGLAGARSNGCPTL